MLEMEERIERYENMELEKYSNTSMSTLQGLGTIAEKVIRNNVRDRERGGKCFRDVSSKSSNCHLAVFGCAPCKKLSQVDLLVVNNSSILSENPAVPYELSTLNMAWGKGL